MADNDTPGIPGVAILYKANDGADSKATVHRASASRTYESVATAKITLLADPPTTFLDLEMRDPKHYHSLVFREPVSFDFQNFSFVRGDGDNIGPDRRKPPPPPTPPPSPPPHEPVLVSRQEVVVWATQTRTFAASVGPGQYVLIKPSSDIWLCHQHPGGNDWVRADGNHIPASSAPRRGESEGALVIWDGTSPLQSFNNYTETRRLPGPLNLLLGPNDWNVDDNQGAIRVVVEIWNP